MSKKPNIIFLLNDHQAFYGHEENNPNTQIKRPYFKKLASEGIEFTQAYTACPLCGPARRTFLTGLFPHNHKELLNEVNHPFDKQTYFEKLNDEGYQCFYYGKWHAGPGTPLSNYECEGFSLPNYGNPYVTEEYKKYLVENNLPPFEVKIHHSLLNPDWPKTKRAGISEGKNHKPSDPELLSEHTTGIMTSPKETHEAFFLAHLACEKLKELAKNDNKEPFHLRVDFWGPHQPYYVPKEFYDLYNPEEISEYPNFQYNMEGKPEIYKFDVNYPISKNGRLITPNPIPWSKWQEILAFHYAQITLVDEAAGLILKRLKELDMDKNTLVVWTTDHGDAVACHGGHFDKDCYMPQEMIRVPLAIRYPEEILPGQKNDALVSSIDLAPTLLAAAGTSFDKKIDGKSLLPLFINKEHEWRNDLMIEMHGHYHLHLGRAIVNDKYKYIYNEKYLDELYDLKNDPYELNNLINNSDYSEVLNEMEVRLRRWREKTGDSMTRRKIRKLISSN